MPTSKPTLSTSDLNALLTELPQWSLRDGKLIRRWKFTSFPEAMNFVNRVAALAEQADHHPDIDIRYTQVELSLISHDAGGITARDARMARQLSAEFPG